MFQRIVEVVLIGAIAVGCVMHEQRGSGSGSLSSSWEGIARIRLREVNGQVLLYDKLPQGVLLWIERTDNPAKK